MNWVCYIIENRGYTYVGVSNDANKRLRAHNGEIKGWCQIYHKQGFWLETYLYN